MKLHDAVVVGARQHLVERLHNIVPETNVASILESRIMDAVDQYTTAVVAWWIRGAHDDAETKRLREALRAWLIVASVG